MNQTKIYVSAAVMLIAAIASVAKAQATSKDTAYHRQITVDREFMPTLRDANKIDVPPAVYSPTVKRVNATLANWLTTGRGLRFQWADVGAGRYGTAIDFDKYRGYAGLRLGSHRILEGEAGYQFVRTETTKLDVWGAFTGRKGKPNYTDVGLHDDVQSRVSDMALQARLQHSLEAVNLVADVVYNTVAFNYYGTYFPATGLPLSSASYNVSDKQRFTHFGVQLGVQNSEDAALRYKGAISFASAGYRYGVNDIGSTPLSLVPNKGMRAGILAADANVNTDLAADLTGGIDGRLMYQSINNEYTDLQSSTHFKVAPYVNWTGENWKTSLGVNIDLLFDQKDRVLLSPRLQAKWSFTDVNELYVNVKGGIEENTVWDIYRENRYAHPSQRVKPARIGYDAELGVKWSATKGMEINLFAGHKHSDDEHLFIANNLESYPWRNTSTAIYTTLKTGKLGASVRTSLLPMTDLSVQLTKYFYNRNSATNLVADTTPFGKPSFAVELNADIRPTAKWWLNAHYTLQTGRKQLFDTASDVYDMGNINELNVRVNYQITSSLSANFGINNLLSQKYELHPGYANFGLNFLGGISWKF